MDCLSNVREQTKTRLGGAQVPINAVTVHVGTGTNLSGLPTNRDLTLG
jgi:hypothetical protein